MLLKLPRCVIAPFVLVLTVLLASCGSTPAVLPPPHKPPVPPLPPSARLGEIRPVCSPTCLTAWKLMVESLLQKPIAAAASPASAPAATTP
ncbi:hypothetical protein UFOVP703_41 [uncultured Caudovirales phage]|uniref:Lipoprotein n=1 Tax=uncultured Caudovirales phage TaxID=2100421 RepID=A0A6J5NJL7_9CAUD|nr:hypothetical protein UFOVP703_41 [uncultured Caudovirales phage]